MSRFYYLRDKENKPRVTICEVPTNDCIYLGMAICSTKDNPCKLEGRKGAVERIKDAVFAGIHCNPVNRPEVKDMLSKLLGRKENQWVLTKLNLGFDPTFKSQYHRI